MFNQYKEMQFVEYNKAVIYYNINYTKLIEIEKELSQNIQNYL